MAFERPTLAQLIADLTADLLARFPTLDPSLANSMAIALSSTFAGALSGAYDYLDFISDQIFPDTATADSLDRWGGIIGVSRVAASAAGGEVTITGTNGSSIPTGATLVSNAGIRYELVTGFVMASSPEDHAIVALDKGADGNQLAAAELTWESAYAGIDPTVIVTVDGITGGRDREGDDAFRTAVLTRMSSPAKGGSQADYDFWAREAVGATRSFAHNWQNGALYGESIPVGEVRHYFAMDDVYADGIPQPGDVTALQDYIQPTAPDSGVAPMGVVYTAIAPTAFPVDVDVTISPLTADTIADTEAALEDAIRNEGTVGGTLELNALQEAMTSVAGLTSWTITDPTGGTAAPAGSLHTTGTLTVT